MAFASVGTLGENQEKTSDTDIVLTTTADAEAGNLVLVGIVCDNADTGDANTTDITVTDSAGNTYTRGLENRNGQAAAGGGIQCGAFFSVLTSTLSSGGTITATHASSITAKTISAWEFTLGTASVAIDATTSAVDDSSAELGAMTLSSLANIEHLFFAVVGIEDTPAAHGYTEDADYTAMDTIGTTGGIDATNVTIHAAFRILTGTTDTHDGSTTGASVNSDAVGVFIALSEVAGTTTPISLAAAATVTATIATFIIRGIALVAAATVAVRMVLQTNKILAAAATVIPTISAAATFVRTLSAAVSVIPTITTAATFARTLTAAVTVTATMNTLRVIIVTLAAGVVVAATMTTTFIAGVTATAKNRLVGLIRGIGLAGRP